MRVVKIIRNYFFLFYISMECSHISRDITNLTLFSTTNSNSAIISLILSPSKHTFRELQKKKIVVSWPTCMQTSRHEYEINERNERKLLISKNYCTHFPLDLNTNCNPNFLRRKGPNQTQSIRLMVWCPTNTAIILKYL
jgi:hypothetical protein